MASHVKRIAILGSTGSIGRQTLDVIRQAPERFQVAALAGGQNIDLLARQVLEFAPSYVWAEEDSLPLRDALAVTEATWLSLEEMAVAGDFDVLVVATAGAAGLVPTIRALEAGRAVAIANKEALVMAGHLLREAAVRGGGELRPIDSEHSAIWQCLWGEEGHEVRRIILTASGGAFRDFDGAQLAAVTAEQALNHPTWKMGRKVTVDSATLMNKGMETIEAMWLFGVPMAKVEVVLHRESIIHSLVEFSDGSVKAQLGLPDMRLPIQLAMAYPDRVEEPAVAPLNLASLGSLHFATPDFGRFPCLELAMEAGRVGGTMPAVMAAADEVAVERFLAGGIGFLEIPALIEQAMRRHRPVADPDLDIVLAADREARAITAAIPAGAGA